MVEGQRDPNKYARESFSMRPATRWQVSAMGIAAAAAVIALVAFVAV